MAKARGNETQSLSILGIGEAEERVYRWLLAHPQSSAAGVARSLDLSSSKAQRLLEAIEDKGLMTHSPERPRRYIPTSPDIAIGALVRDHRDSLDRVLGAIPELVQQVARGRDKHEQVVELISNRESKRHTYEQLHATAKEEMVFLIKPPLMISRLDVPASEDHPYQTEAQARGVRYRSVVDVECLEVPGVLSAVREDVAAGEEVRVVSKLPFKMAIADRHTAFIPLHLEQPDSPSLLVRSSALLDALYALFEMLWEGATPISFTNGVAKVGKLSTRLPKDADELVSLMMAGLNDKKIASELGMSASTLTRRISELMKTFGARTRFQLGCRLTRYSLDNNGK